MDLALLFCCQALRRNLSSPGYAWIVPGWYGDEWWRGRVSGIEINCTLEDLEDFLNSSVVVVSHYPDSLNDTAVTTSGIVSFRIQTVGICIAGMTSSQCISSFWLVALKSWEWSYVLAAHWSIALCTTYLSFHWVWELHRYITLIYQDWTAPSITKGPEQHHPLSNLPCVHTIHFPCLSPLWTHWICLFPVIL